MNIYLYYIILATLMCNHSFLIRAAEVEKTFADVSKATFHVYFFCSLIIFGK